MIFLVESPFSRRDYDRFGIGIFLKDGFEVEVWDITSILQPVTHKTYTPPDKSEYERLRTFKDKKELLKSISSLRENDFVIALLGYYFRSAFVYRALSGPKTGYAVLTANVIPDVGEVHSDPGRKRLKKLFPITPKRIMESISARMAFSKLPFRWFGIMPARLILAGGERSKDYPYPVDRSTEVVWAHSLDYDRYLEEKNRPSQDEKPVAVFLDEYMPFHPDWKHMGIECPISADEYYRLLNNFFNVVERSLGMEVVIAGHPRSNTDKIKSFFGARKLIIGQTCKLVKESNLVLCHASTSIGFANLFNKPALFMTFKEIEDNLEGRMTRTMAGWFGKEAVSIDKDISIDWAKEMRIDRASYGKYRQAFIKRDGTEELPFWQIVSNRLRG